MEFAVTHSFQSLVNELRGSFPACDKLTTEMPDDLCDQLSAHKAAIGRKDPAVLTECRLFADLGFDEIYVSLKNRERVNFWKKLAEVSKVNSLVDLGRLSSLGDAVADVANCQDMMIRQKDDRVVIDQMEIMRRMMESGRLLEITREFASSPEKLRKAAETVSELLGTDITPLMENQTVPDFDDPATAESLNAGIYEMMGLMSNSKTEVKMDGSISLGNLQAKMKTVIDDARRQQEQQRQQRQPPNSPSNDDDDDDEKTV